MRSAMHQAGASALAQLLRYDPPGADHRMIPCPCGHSAHYKELRSKTVMTVLGLVELSRPYYLCDDCSKGQYPADVELDIAGLESSPGVRRMEAVVGSEMPFAGGCEPMKLLAGLDGEIFRTDFTGDGTVSDILPGTKMGSLNRSISISELSSVIQNYNKTVANQPTPAGQVLINNGLFTLAQLQALGGVVPRIPLPPQGEVGVGSLRAFDLKLSWVHRFGERITIEPNVGFFNLFNFANFDLTPNVISGLLTGSAGSVNGTTKANRITNRVGLGTGVFALGAPRAVEFGMRISF